MDAIHEMVQEDRKGVRETLQVLDEDHPRFKNADYTLTYNPVQPSPRPVQSDPIAEGSPLKPKRRKVQLLLELHTKSWKPKYILCSTIEKDRQHVLTESQLDIILSSGKWSCLQIALSANEVDKIATELAQPKESTSGGSRFRIFPLAPWPDYLSTPSRNLVYYRLAFSTSTRKDACGIQISPSKYTSPALASWQGILDIEFQISSDADEIYRLLIAICEEVQSSWIAHVQAFASIDGKMETGSAEELVSLTCCEQEEWWNSFRHLRSI